MSDLAKRIAGMPGAYYYTKELFENTFHKYKFGHWRYKKFNYAVWDNINQKWVVMEKP